jgi:hypothetical protein
MPPPTVLMCVSSPCRTKAADEEVVVRVHVVAAARAVEDFVAEHPHRSESWPAGLIFVKIEARLAGDEGVGVPSDVG